MRLKEEESLLQFSGGKSWSRTTSTPHPSSDRAVTISRMSAADAVDSCSPTTSMPKGESFLSALMFPPATHGAPAWILVGGWSTRSCGKETCPGFTSILIKHMDTMKV